MCVHYFIEIYYPIRAICACLGECDVGGEVDGVVALHLLQGQVEGAAGLLQPTVAGTRQRREGGHTRHTTCIVYTTRKVRTIVLSYT